MGGVKHNYYSNLPLFKLIRVNNLFRNQKVARGTPTIVKEVIIKYFTTVRVVVFVATPLCLYICRHRNKQVKFS